MPQYRSVLLEEWLPALSNSTIPGSQCWQLITKTRCMPCMFLKEFPRKYQEQNLSNQIRPVACGHLNAPRGVHTRVNLVAPPRTVSTVLPARARFHLTRAMAPSRCWQLRSSEHVTCPKFEQKPRHGIIQLRHIHLPAACRLSLRSIRRRLAAEKCHLTFESIFRRASQEGNNTLRVASDCWRWSRQLLRLAWRFRGRRLGGTARPSKHAAEKTTHGGAIWRPWRCRQYSASLDFKSSGEPNVADHSWPGRRSCQLTHPAGMCLAGGRRLPIPANMLTGPQRLFFRKGTEALFPRRLAGHLGPV